jgi:hypothetical protein
MNQADEAIGHRQWDSFDSRLGLIGLMKRTPVAGDCKCPGLGLHPTSAVEDGGLAEGFVLRVEQCAGLGLIPCAEA